MSANRACCFEYVTVGVLLRQPPSARTMTSSLPLLCLAGRHLGTVIRALAAAGWPPVFVFVFDDLWRYIAEHVWSCMTPVLGTTCVLEPSIYAWALSVGRKSGESFTLPHRDYPYSEAFDSRGRPAIVNVWVPITDATLDNGCMYVLPKEFDPLFHLPEHPLHLKCAIPGPRDDEVRVAAN